MILTNYIDLTNKDDLKELAKLTGEGWQITEHNGCKGLYISKYFEPETPAKHIPWYEKILIKLKIIKEC
jgi:hypothetical protein